MSIDPEGTWDWGKFLGWAATAVLAIAAVVAIAVVAAGVVASGGLLGAILVGAGVGTLFAMGTSIVAQNGLANSNPWSVFNAGIIGGSIGAFAGLSSFGFALLGESIGNIIGITLANTPNISTGILFGKVYGTGLLMSLGQILGGAIGGIVGGTLGNYVANLIFKNDLTINETLNQGILGEVPAWVIKSFRWLFN